MQLELGVELAFGFYWSVRMFFFFGVSSDSRAVSVSVSVSGFGS